MRHIFKRSLDKSRSMDTIFNGSLELAEVVSMSALGSHQVQDLDPHALLAVLDKRVIHPGGASTARQLDGSPAPEAL